MWYLIIIYLNMCVFVCARLHVLIYMESLGAFQSSEIVSVCDKLLGLMIDTF